tara:strand:- start:196 stop:519 length:324 start_codon:yes stop_codon:yes gene_type:complete
MLLSEWKHIIRSTDNNPNKEIEYIRAAELHNYRNNAIPYVKKAFSSPKAYVRGKNKSWHYKVYEIECPDTFKSGNTTSLELAILYSDITAIGFGYKLYRPFFFNKSS